MKIVTILGTRPEIIRLSRIIPVLDAHAEHVLVHTGQSNSPLLNDIFFSGMEVRQPDVQLDIHGGTFGQQIGRVLAAAETILERERPDRVVILGDTNSAMAAFVACRMGIPVYHLEAGNRCFDDRVPEEVNRRLIDHSSRILMPYTERSRLNLLREGIPGERIFVTGNPMLEVLESRKASIGASDVLGSLGLTPGGYFLVTTHRQENVDLRDRLEQIRDSLVGLIKEYGLPVIWTVHPRTQARLAAFAVDTSDPLLRVVEPFGFADFIALEQGARCVLSDSGTVQEECCLLHVPNVTLRDVTERPETVECGSNILAGVAPDAVLRTVGVAISRTTDWVPPREYLERTVSATVANIVLGHREGG